MATVVELIKIHSHCCCICLPLGFSYRSGDSKLVINFIKIFHMYNKWLIFPCALFVIFNAGVSYIIQISLMVLGIAKTPPNLCLYPYSTSIETDCIRVTVLESAETIVNKK